ncbi:glycosyltransferase family 4 protein [Segatella baroniae]|uniref:glycosyltransferase family 4 protein n=1 Tax=Segatella baroniae TaxID=305719 RepID=UPI00040847DA|nr:glycosyltransferase family 1 protein [Segatella baroniae]
MITINGQFTARRVTGQERFALEMIIELDKICEKGQYELVVPQNAFNIPTLQNISIIKYGKAKGSAWEQIFFAWYMITHPKNISLNLLTIMPVFKPGIICIHDMSYRTHPEYCKTVYMKISRYWHLFQEELAKRFSPILFTVSEYSKNQMIKNLNIPFEKITVLGNGWDHFKSVKQDDSIKNRNPALFEKPYFFSLGSLAPNKNIKWVIEVAKKHPQYNFLIAGKANLRSYGTEYNEVELKNVFFLGYISDGEVKYLMSNCKAFIFPSFYEGFGIPPLEALSVGAKCIVAESSCLPEIFDNTVFWIDPYDTNINLDKLISNHISAPNHVLEKYTFKNFAIKLHESLLPFING